MSPLQRLRREKEYHALDDIPLPSLSSLEARIKRIRHRWATVAAATGACSQNSLLILRREVAAHLLLLGSPVFGAGDLGQVMLGGGGEEAVRVGFCVLLLRALVILD